MVVNLKSDEVIIWIPRTLSPEYKLETVSNGITTTVTDDLLYAECSLVVTNSIGEFTLLLDNNENTYNDFYVGGETVNIYVDYDNGTTKIFSGIIKNIKKKYDSEGNKIELTGGYISSELFNITVTKTYTDTAISTILTEIINEYLTGYTTTNVATTTTTATLTWENKPFWECVIDLCNRATFDCYVDTSKDFNFFAKESKTNQVEGIIESDTLITEEGLSDTLEDIKNRIIVYGAEIDGLPIMYTVEDSSSQTDYNMVNEIVIRDEDITTITEAKQRGDNELLILKNKTVEGKVLCMGLPLLNVGELIYTDIPTQNISAKYRAAKIIHKLDLMGDNFFTSEVFLDSEPKVLQHILRDNIIKTREQRKSVNKNAMKYSNIYPFDSSMEASTTNSTIITGGVLKLVSGQSTGNMTTTTYTANANVTDIELRCQNTDDCVIGTTLKVEVTCDNGVSWTNIEGIGLKGSSGVKTSIASTKQGKKLKLKVTLTSTAAYINPELDSLAVLFNT